MRSPVEWIRSRRQGLTFSVMIFAIAVILNSTAVSAGAVTGDKIWSLTNGFGGNGDTVCTYGVSGDVPVSGDWNGDGKDSPGVFRNGSWYLSNACGGAGDIVFSFGVAGDIPVVGDWNGDGIDTPGVFRGSQWYLSNSFGGYGDYVFVYGVPSDAPVVGDWNGDGRDTVGIYRDSLWHLSDYLGGGVSYSFSYGSPGDRPVVGDWNGDGRDTVGIARFDEWWLSDSLGGYGDHVFTYGVPSDQRVVGDWDASGSDTPGIARDGNATCDLYVKGSALDGSSDDSAYDNACFVYTDGLVDQTPKWMGTAPTVCLGCSASSGSAGILGPVAGPRLPVPSNGPASWAMPGSRFGVPVSGAAAAATLAITSIAVLAKGLAVPWPDENSTTAQKYKNYNYKLYHIYAKADSVNPAERAWKWGITRQDGSVRPQGQVSGCNTYYRRVEGSQASCDWRWIKKDINGWFEARVLEATYAYRYKAKYGKCPDGMLYCL